MICKVCGTEMRIGKVIDPGYLENALYIAPVAPLTEKTLEIIDCYKCPKCGHSEYITPRY